MKLKNSAIAAILLCWILTTATFYFVNSKSGGPFIDTVVASLVTLITASSATYLAQFLERRKLANRIK